VKPIELEMIQKEDIIPSEIPALLYRCYRILLEYLNNRSETLLFTEQFMAGDETKEDNYMLGHIVRYQLLPVFLAMFSNDEEFYRVGHVWTQLTSKKFPDFISLYFEQKTILLVKLITDLNEISNVSNDFRFMYLIIECLQERILHKVLKIIINFYIQSLSCKATLFTNFEKRNEILNVATLLSTKLPAVLNITSHREHFMYEK